MECASASNSRGDPETYAIIGAAMEVHHVLGHGFLEAVYQEALANEFSVRQIPFEREKAMSILFKGKNWMLAIAQTLSASEKSWSNSRRSSR